MTDESWQRIPDNEAFDLGRREIRFRFPRGCYLVVWDPTLQHEVTVEFDGSKETWPLSIREADGDRARLQGMADWVPEILGDVCWFELVIDDQASITYWGNQVVYRQDFAD